MYVCIQQQKTKNITQQYIIEMIKEKRMHTFKKIL